jgi:hypothetical protein
MPGFLLRARYAVFPLFQLCVLGHGQLAEWTLSSLTQELAPKGVQIFESYVTQWPSLGAWLIVADINFFNTSGGWNLGTHLSQDGTDYLSTVREFSVDFGATIGTNGGFFGTSNGKGVSYSLAAADKNLYAPNLEALSRNSLTYYPTRCAFGVDNNGAFDAYWIYANNNTDDNNATISLAYSAPSPNYQQYPNPQPMPNNTFPSTAIEWNLSVGVGGGPMLVYEAENVAMSSFDAEVMWGSGVPSEIAAARTAIGFGIPAVLSLSVPHLIWLAVDGEDDITGISLPDLAQEFLKLGAHKACNLDGGGSTQLVVNGELINKPDGGTYERQLAASVMLFAQ